jgi:peptidoglycan hydrolase-like protein with peptidoglycan-binding domain
MLEEAMQQHRNLITALIAIVLLGGAALETLAQDSRPRHNSPQYGERTWNIPPDTVISVQLNGTLTSRTARVGDKFTAAVTVPIYVNGKPVIPAGSIIEGRVTQVTPAKRMNRSGTIGVDFDDVVFPNGATIQLVGNLTSDDPEVRRRIDDESRVSGQGNKRPSVFIGGGGAMGAVLGGIAGGGKGAVLGGVVGAGAGVAGVLLSKGEEAEVPSGTTFGVQLKQGLIIRESFISESAPIADQTNDQVPSRSDVNGPSRSQPDPIDRPAPERNEPEPRTDVDRAEPALPLSSPEMVRRAQIALKEQGYYEGEPDGVVSPRTASALRTYQKEHSLPESGDLDPQTARSLGIMGTSAPSDRSRERPRDVRTENSAASEAVMANVLSATASRTQDGAVYVLITTQANSGGWRWFEEHVVNGDTLEIYARGVRPSGMATQVLTRGRIELTEKDGVQYVRRVVIHSAGGDQVIPFSGARPETTADARRPETTADTRRPERTADPSVSSGTSGSSAVTLQRKAEDLLAEYQRVYGVRMTGTGVQLDNAAQYREPEIELLFAIDSFANATQLYTRLTGSLSDRQSVRAATLAMAKQARRADRVISTTTSRGADVLAAKWDSIREDVLRLMQTYNINSSEIEN